MPISAVVAALLSLPGMRGVTIYRTLYFLPVVTLPAAVALTWKWLFNGDYGLINWLLSKIGIDGPHWLSDPSDANRVSCRRATGEDPPLLCYR